MIPRGLNRRELERLMRTMKIKIEDLSTIQQVILKSPSKDIIIDNPVVNVFEVKGEKIFQITGKISEKPILVIPEEDIQLVAQQTGSSFEEAKKTLEQTNGDIAAAILSIKEKKKV
jgi:nascent polypeptide-associated complex subunit alpha